MYKVKRIIKDIDNKINNLEKEMKEEDAVVFIVGGETTGKVNATFAGNGITLISIIKNAIEYDESLRDIFMAAILGYIEDNPQLTDEDLMGFPMGNNDNSIN